VRCRAALRRLCAATGAAVILPGAAAAATGSQVWAQAGCSGCHTLQAAGAYGDGGPNLDQLRPSSAAVAAQVTSGGPGMPSFGGSLSSSDIQALASWVSSVAGGGASTAPAGAPAGPASDLASAAVRRIQRELARLGFFRHAVTGYYGPVTTAAVKAFQRSAGLTPDGVWGSETKSALVAALRSARSSTSPTGSPGGLSPREVKKLQTDLMHLGYFNGPVTGFYGPITTRAVEQFQRSAGLTPDGVWGPRSQAALAKRL
jgi:peptidoglycan hydrolase-like protein with peptidoglycan-binding domain